MEKEKYMNINIILKGNFYMVYIMEKEKYMIKRANWNLKENILEVVQMELERTMIKMEN